ncbi:UDP-N-acetylmuramoyl-L-alanine--D-glutamate ligase [Gilvimarinus sp. F26214L]|uniref:UDP-N-acetylmuramoyl-L-alanine--D-glutamate ligase n=1 Tax=Gilvimarinus sp. DZF01 TaxID=3461371 RepID=UPI00404573AE
MPELIASSELTAIIGTGETGLSVARYLASKNQRFVMFDTRQAPPNLERVKADFPDVRLELGDLRATSLQHVTRVIVSPGVSPDEAALREVRERGVPVLGDIQLFVNEISAPLVAITGSNGKSTVTTLVGEMLKTAGMRVAVGGNLGTPALDLLGEVEPDVYVLELSSFQLETVDSVNAEVATILNISLDHLDRHAGLLDYHRIKQRVYFGAKKVVVNREDPLTQPPLRPDQVLCSFGLDRPDLGHFGLIEEGGESWLAFGLQKLLSAKELRLQGRHNLANALAALAIGHHMGADVQRMLETLRRFPGLVHRCQWVGERDGIDFINDSKGTNVGATLAAIQGLARTPARLILIAGGEGKGADFSELAPVMKESLRALVSIGVDGEQIATVARSVGVNVIAASSMEDAVHKAATAAEPGDAVLLSPACASFDMFSSYMDRGERFMAAVEELTS